MLRKIRLQNFKQHTDLTVNLTNGLNMIQGDNGSGKTTILKGILYALFGASAAGAKEYLTNWGGGTMSVELTIDLPESGTVIITRKLNGAKVEDQEGCLLASGQTPVTVFLEYELGMSGKILKNLLCAEQGDSQGMLKMGATGLQEQLETVAKADVIDKVLERLSKDTSSLNGQLSVLISEVDLPALKSQVALLQDEQETRKAVIEGTFSKLEDLKVKLTSAKEELTSAEVANAKIEQDYDRLELYVQAVNKAQKQVTETEQALKLMPSESYLTNVIAQYETQASQYRDEWERLVKGQVDFDTWNTVLEKTRKEVQYLNFIHGYNLQFQGLTNQVEVYTNEEQEVVKQCNDLHHMIATNKCKTCGSALADNLATLEANLAQQLVKKEAASQLTKEAKLRFIAFWEELYKTYSYLTHKDFDNIEVKVKDAVARLTKLTAMEFKPVSDEAKFELRQASHTKDKQANEAKHKLHEVKMLRGQLDKAREQLNQSASKATELTATIGNKVVADTKPLKEKVVYLSSRHQEVLELYHQAKTQFKVGVERLANAKTKLDAELVLAEKRKEVSNSLRLRNNLTAFLRKNRGALLQDSWDGLMQYASALLETTSEGLMSNLTREDGIFYIQEKGRVVPVTEVSGARKSLTGLCLRIALANTFYGNQGFTLLDEITADATEDNSAKIAGMLRSLDMQVIMVSHRLNDTLNAHNVIAL